MGRRGGGEGSERGGPSMRFREGITRTFLAAIGGCFSDMTEEKRNDVQLHF
jgi:hypothetical protein